MKIFIEDLHFKTIIGILEFEREEPQEVIVNLEIEYTYNKKEFINYADVVNFIKKDIKSKQYHLLEDILLELPKLLKEKFSQIKSLKLKITKPAILPDCRVSLEDYFFFDS
jgi:dihydroneopterin aldolase